MKFTKTIAASLIAVSLGAGSAYSNENCDITLLDAEIANLTEKLDSEYQKGVSILAEVEADAVATFGSGVSDENECSRRDFVFRTLEQAFSQL